MATIVNKKDFNLVERLYNELDELDERIGKLKGFIDSVQYSELSNSEKDMLSAQEFHMVGYRHALHARIELIVFNGKNI